MAVLRSQIAFQEILMVPDLIRTKLMRFEPYLRGFLTLPCIICINFASPWYVNNYQHHTMYTDSLFFSLVREASSQIMFPSIIP